MMKASNIHFEMAERGRALNYGGIGAIHLMGQRLGLAEEIDSRLELLKMHLPEHESDQVLNLAYNALLDGQRLVDVDGTHAGTLGECKGGMALSYTGIWGYAPLIVTLANTREVLYLVNRPGNVVSHEGCVPWIDRAIELLRPRAAEITLRGDTDFTLSAELDRWDGQGIKFIFGMDAHPKVVQLAESLPETAWKPLERLARCEIATEPRRKPQRIKESIVRFKGYMNKKLMGESVAEFDYQPNKCGRRYRLVVVRKNISVQKGERVLLEDIKYFFYITNHSAYCAEQIVALANQRCDQENVIEQLKNGVNAMRMPVDDLLSNWAYMVMSALAWNLKAWYGLLMPNRQRGLELLGMEFRRFLHLIVLLPAQIVRSGRRIFTGSWVTTAGLKTSSLAGRIFVGWHLPESRVDSQISCGSRGNNRLFSSENTAFRSSQSASGDNRNTNIFSYFFQPGFESEPSAARSVETQPKSRGLRNFPDPNRELIS